MNALSKLNTEVEEICHANGVAYSFATFYSGGVTTVAAALNELANAMVGVGAGSGGGVLSVFDDDDPLYDAYTYGRWVMPVGGTLGIADFLVTTAPLGGDCTLGIYLNSVLAITITIPSGATYPSAVVDCSSVVYVARDVIELKTITVNAAGELTGTISL